MKRMKKLAAVAVAGAMALSVTACGSSTSWAAELDGNPMKAGVYITYLMHAYSAAANQMEDVSDEELLKQQIDGKGAEQWIVEETERNVRKHFAVDKKFEEYGLVLDDILNIQIDSAVSSQWPYFSEFYTSNGVSEESFRIVTENSYKSSMVFEKLYGAEGLEPVPDEELLQKLDNDYRKTRYIAFPLKDDGGEALDDTAQKALREKVQEYYDRAQKGEDFDQLIIEREKEVAKEQGKEEELHSHDTQGIHDRIFPLEGSGYPEKFVAELKDAAIDKVLQFEDEEYVYLAQRLDLSKDAEALAENRLNLLYELKNDEYTERLLQWGKELEIQFNDAAVKRYTPKKVKLG